MNVDAFVGLFRGVIPLVGLIIVRDVEASPVTFYIGNGYSHGCC